MPKVFIPSIPYRIRRDGAGKPLRDHDTGEVLKDPAVDVTIASAYGEIQNEPVFGGHGVPPAAMAANINQVKRALRDFNPSEDSIIAVGDPVAVALCCAVAVREFGGFSILRWAGNTRQYVKMDFKI